MASKKRKINDQLTGGTGDVNPQQYIIFEDINQATVATQGFPLPVPRFGAFGASRSVVFELLAVHWILNTPPIPGAAATIMSVRAAVTTNPITPPVSPLATDARALSVFNRGWVIPAAGTAVTATTEHLMDEFIDLTDEAGHGVLIATDNIYMAVRNEVHAGNATLLSNLTAKLYYRMKEVSLQEYVGIVQSQQ